MRRWSAIQKATNAPGVMRPSLTSVAPYQKTMRTPTALIQPIIGPMEPRTRARVRFLSRYD